MRVFTYISINFTQVFIVCILFGFIQYINIYIVSMCWTCPCQIFLLTARLFQIVFNMSHALFQLFLAPIA